MAKKEIKITFMLTPRLNDRLEAYAESQEKSKSEVLRELIEDYVPERGTRENTPPAPPRQD